MQKMYFYNFSSDLLGIIYAFLAARFIIYSGWQLNQRRDAYRARIFKRLWSPGIDSNKWIPQAYVAWRAGTITLFLLGS